MKDKRTDAIKIATNLIGSARREVNKTSVPHKVADAIEDAVLVTCWGRAANPQR